MKRKKILVIDFFNIYIRNFSAVPTHSQSTGDPNGGLFGTLRSIKSLVDKHNPDKVVMISDGPGGSARRRKEDPNYKSGRKLPRRLNKKLFETHEEEQVSFWRQYKRLLEYFKRLPLYFIQVEDVEADDGIAHLITTSKEEEYIIISTDRDFLQLISDNVSVFNPERKIMFSVDNFREHWYNIPPYNFVVTRTMIGDTSDDIPGLDRMGYKTAIKVFPILTLDEKVTMKILFEYCEEKKDTIAKGKTNWYEIVLRNRERLELNYKLMQLSDVNMHLGMVARVNDIYRQPSKMITPFSMRRMFLEDQMNSHIRDFDAWIRSFSKLSSLGK